MRNTIGWIVLGGLAAASGPAPAQAVSNIDPGARHAWGENIGWIDAQAAGGGAAGVVVGRTFLSGHAWSESFGWIDLGDGSPADGIRYGNATGDDAGVNLDLATGTLSGLAWGENLGWINFDTAALGEADRARFDPFAHAFSGYAWGENVGWIDLGAQLGVVDPADDLGFGLAGTGGLTPRTALYGLLSTGNEAVFVMHDAAPQATFGLFAGVVFAPTPFKGGFLVPVPWVLLFVLGTDGLGQFTLPVPGGTGSSALDVSIQCVVVDPGGPAGYALGNALEAHWEP